ncbi:MAG TPA: hypothetical protein VIH57_07390 [Bacteroidales bacterium]
MAENATYIKGEELLKVFKNLPWDDLFIRMEAYIVYSLRYKYGNEDGNEQLKTKAHEIINEVIDLIFVTGSRNWCKEDCPDFTDFLFGVVKSHINNSFNKKPKKFEPLDDKLEGQLNIQDTISADELRKTIFDELKTLNADDEELMVFECMADGITKPDKISQELGVDSTYLNNILRRLYRKISKIKNKISDK